MTHMIGMTKMNLKKFFLHLIVIQVIWITWIIVQITEA